MMLTYTVSHYSNGIANARSNILYKISHHSSDPAKNIAYSAVRPIPETNTSTESHMV